MQKYILIAVLAYCCCFVTGTRNNVLIFLKANEYVDTNQIKKLDRTQSLYKVKGMKGWSDPRWNFGVLSRDFLTDDAARENYVSSIRDFSFVDEVDVVYVKGESPDKITMWNNAIKNVRKKGKKAGTLPTRPLKQQSKPVIKCEPVDAGEDETMYLITTIKIRNATAFREFSKSIAVNALAPLGIEIVYGGKPVSDHWDYANIQNYGNKETWCEYLLSEFVATSYVNYQKSIAAQRTYTAVEV